MLVIEFRSLQHDFAFPFLFGRWTNTDESIRSGMAVLDVSVPTGYMIQQQKLDAYILSQRVRNLQRARFQERKVLFYFDFVSDYCDHYKTNVSR